MHIAGAVKSISGCNDDGAVAIETVSMPGVDCVAPAAIEPLSMDILVGFGPFCISSYLGNIFEWKQSKEQTGIEKFLSHPLS